MKLNLKHKIKDSDRLFFGEWRYSVRLSIRGSAVLRGIGSGKLTIQDVAAKVKGKTYWDWNSQSQFGTEKSVNAHAMKSLYLLFDSMPDIKIAITYDGLLIYCNSLDFIERIKLPMSVPYEVTKININRPEGTIYKRNSKFKYRMQFRHRKCSDTSRDGLLSFIKMYGGLISPSKALVSWLETPVRDYIHSHFFIDVNDDKLGAVFDLMIPGIRRCTSEIINKVVS